MDNHELHNSPTSSSPPLEPVSKKPKMSSTTTSDDETTLTTTTTTTKPRRYKRRKIAIIFAYCGVGYQGMQKNPGAKTIEGDFEEALYHAGAIPEPERGQPKRFDWARSARTDKGVSAVGQVVSGRFYIDPPGFIERLNNNLCAQIRVFGFKRVTGSFNAKKFCDKRRYVYLIPVFALDPNCHRDRESVMASVGSGNELVKCLECSERGRKVDGLMGNKRKFLSGISSNSWCVEGNDGCFDGDTNVVVGLVDDDVGLRGLVETSGLVNEVGGSTNVTLDDKGNDVEEPLKNDVGSRVLVGSVDSVNEEDGSQVLVQSGISSNIECAMMKTDGKDVSLNDNGNKVEEPLKNEEGSQVLVDCGNSLNEEKDKQPCDMNLKNDNVRDMDMDVVNSGAVNGEEGSKGDQNGCGDGEESEKKEKKSEFKYGDEVKERFNRILKYYEGTHNFHNFTTRTKAEDPAAKRYILSFQANTIVTVEGIEFVKCEVVGQSFMLHQIRKMMGLAVAIMRNFASESIFERVYRQDVNINVPTAPEVGLYLDECFFNSYNKKWKDSHEEVSMKDYAEEAEEFKLKHIYSHIANTEHKEGAVALWLHSLNYRNYSDLRPVDSDIQVNIESKSTEGETLAGIDTMAVSS